MEPETKSMQLSTIDVKFDKEDCEDSYLLCFKSSANPLEGDKNKLTTYKDFTQPLFKKHKRMRTTGNMIYRFE